MIGARSTAAFFLSFFALERGTRPIHERVPVESRDPRRLRE